MTAMLGVDVDMKSTGPRTPDTGEAAPMSIGDLAGRFGLATHVLRHWESVGLLAPARDGAGRRRYGAADRTRVAVILRAKEAGLSLDAVRALVAAAEDAGARRDLLRAEAEALRARIAAAQASLGLLECALACDHEDVTRCARFRQLAARGEGP
ncbi:MerR family transcriptional regulator [Kitasatospora sp. NPDC056184]|uniref:MerR family transcriptional regulator n=1 Tax=Kitasatospora sp. NPDC056184 TaxID=3345738 RepID=UPI0035DE6D3E